MKRSNFFASYGYYTPSNYNYHLHCHDEYEIYMFFEGDSKYIVEEKNYTLNPHDIIIIKKHEMHRVWHNSNKKYSRLTINISPDFFEENNCKEYEQAFLKDSPSSGNKICSGVVHSVGLYDAIMRLREFSHDFETNDSPVVKSALIEILYYINKISSFDKPDEAETPVKEIINYINNHFTQDIKLDFLCEHFYISKYYLCRAFKAYTGLTVQGYIKEKRLAYFDELRKSNLLLTEAAYLAGFNDYSVFYRTYVKKYGCSPEHNI